MTRNWSCGFSLVELMVAMVVGSLLAWGLVSAQNYSLGLSSYNNEAWDNINYTQSLMILHGQDNLAQTTGTWVMDPGSPDYRWRSTLYHSSENNLWAILETRVHGVELKWSWPVHP